MKIHTITYGDTNYISQREFFRETAEVSSFFDSVKVYTPNHIKESFKKEYKYIWNSRRGGGYWIWKPLIVKRVLDTLPKDDILIFCDAGCMINRKGKKRFYEYTDQLMDSTSGSIAFELNFQEYKYTKQEIFDYFGASEQIRNAEHTISGIMMFRKGEHAKMLVDKWYQALLDFPMLFTDYYDPEIQDPRFVENRHDQSLISIIRRKYGSEFIKDETYFLDFVRDGQDYPFWASRLSG